MSGSKSMPLWPPFDHFVLDMSREFQVTSHPIANRCKYFLDIHHSKQNILHGFSMFYLCTTSKYLDQPESNRSYASALIGLWRLQHVSLALAWGSWSDESLERCWLKTTGENAVRDAPRPGDLPEVIWDVGCPWAYMY